METYERLEAALTLIANERDWRQGPGEGGDPRFCLTEAVRAAGGCVAEMDALAEALPISGSVMTFNDSRPHSEVVALFEEAIVNEKARLAVVLPIAQVDELVPAEQRLPSVRPRPIPVPVSG